MEAAGTRVTALEEELDAARDELTEKEAAQLDAEKDEKGARGQEEKTLEELNDLRLAIATARQRLESVEAQRQPMAARDQELLELIASRKADIASYESKLTSQAQENRDAEVAIKEQTARAAEFCRMARERPSLSHPESDRQSSCRLLLRALSTFGK